MDSRFARLDPSAIDDSDSTFRVRTRHSAALRESIERCGIRSPLLVEEMAQGGRHRIVSGWGRWAARPPDARIPCFVLPADLGLESVWDLVIRDNDAWSVVDTARLLRALERVPGLDAERIVSEKLPMLGMHASRDLWRRHLRLLELPRDALDFIEAEGLPLRRALSFLKLPAEALHGLLERSRELQLTLNELCESIELLEEIAGRDRVPASSVLERIASSRSPPGKEAFRRALRELRYPELTRYREKLEEVEKALRFSVPVRFEWDARLERPGVRISVDLADEGAAATFERELAAQSKVLRRFFEVL